MLLLHDIRRADSRALCTAGRSKATKSAMIAIKVSGDADGADPDAFSSAGWRGALGSEDVIGEG